MGSSHPTRGRLEGLCGRGRPLSRCVGGAWTGAGATRRIQRCIRDLQNCAAIRGCSLWCWGRGVNKGGCAARAQARSGAKPSGHAVSRRYAYVANRGDCGRYPDLRDCVPLAVSSYRRLV
jgi:hypothetical protein